MGLCPELTDCLELWWRILSSPVFFFISSEPTYLSEARLNFSLMWCFLCSWWKFSWLRKNCTKSAPTKCELFLNEVQTYLKIVRLLLRPIFSVFWCELLFFCSYGLNQVVFQHFYVGLIVKLLLGDPFLLPVGVFRIDVDKVHFFKRTTKINVAYQHPDDFMKKLSEYWDLPRH